MCTSIVDINTDFDKDGRIKTFSPMCWNSSKYDCFTVIGYKLFTDQALWVFTNSDEEMIVNVFMKGVVFLCGLHLDIEHNTFLPDYFFWKGKALRVTMPTSYVCMHMSICIPAL